MTALVQIRPCLTLGCSRLPRPGWAYCDACADRLVARAVGESAPAREPEWIRRMRTRGLPAKDYSTVA